MHTQHFKSNLRDLFFNLFEWNKTASTILNQAPFTHLDEDTLKETLNTIQSLCHNEFAASYIESDRLPLRLDQEGNVTLPASLSQSIKTFFTGEWHRLNLPEDMGGLGLPPSVYWAATEMVFGANPVLGLYTFGSVIAQTLAKCGTEAQKRRFIPPLLERHWSGTMVLTEPDAGSDVGLGTTSARPMPDGTWEIRGVKRFITNGDFDSVENIIHLVLARPEGAGPGTKGLSMFVVPKIWVQEDGTLGERNGVYCTNIEKKMGIKGSATCEMTFGERQPARGLLVGDIHSGISQMFLVIVHARMLIGVKSCAQLSTGYLNALEYSKMRIQGADLKEMSNKNASRVPIIQHPDIRRMLMSQKAHAEGMRALYMFTSHGQDRIAILQQQQNQTTDLQKKELQDLESLNELLLPLLKGFNSEQAQIQLNYSLQCLGGSGYCQDYPIEQYLRDQRIDSLYEGTTHIQALDLFFRKVVRDRGQSLSYLNGMMEQHLHSLLDCPTLGAEARALAMAMKNVAAMVQTLQKKAQESAYHVGLQGNRFLTALAQLVVGDLLLQQGALAQQKLQQAASMPENERAFYQGKVASARYWCHEIFPEIAHARGLIEQSNLALMELSAEAFGV